MNIETSAVFDPVLGEFDAACVREGDILASLQMQPPPIMGLIILL